MKTILIIALCAPLGVIAWYEGKRLGDLPQPPPPAPLSTPPSDEVTQIKESANSVLRMPESVAAAAVTLDDPPDGADSKDPLGQLVLDQARARARSRDLVKAARLKAVATEQKLKSLCDSLRGEDGRIHKNSEKLTKLEQDLKAYEELDAYDPELHASLEAEKDWAKDIEDRKASLERLYGHLDQWTTSTSTTELPAERDLAMNIKAYRTFINTHGRAKGAKAVALVQETREGLVLWESGDRIVVLLRDPSDRRLDQIRGVVTLAEDNPPPRLEATARRLVRILCGDFLKREDLDRRVLLVSENARDDPRMRQDVIVCFKDGVKKKLPDTIFDEYSLPREMVEKFDLPRGGIHELAINKQIQPLKGTPYSDAVRGFNAEREMVRHWNEDELKRLQKTCQPHQEALSQGGTGATGATLLKRIADLIEIVHGHPSLFVASSP